MPTVEYHCQVDSVRLSRRCIVPRKVTDVWAWLKEARLAIPQIPVFVQVQTRRDSGPVEWYTAADPHIDARWIRVDLVHKDGKKAVILIDRSTPSIG